MLQRSENIQVTRFTILISPIYCNVRINRKNYSLLNGDIQSYLEIDSTNLKPFYSLLFIDSSEHYTTQMSKFKYFFFN